MPHRFFWLDVFTDEGMKGNPLAVVLDADGFPATRMQSIAREFNLSETVFVQTPKDARHRANLRIFTPGKELPFAGHPTIGTAVLLATLDRNGESGAVAFGLEEVVGTVACAVDVKGGTLGEARFSVPRIPEEVGEGRDAGRCAAVLGLELDDIGLEKHRPSRHSAGVAFDFVPVATREALARATPCPGMFTDVFFDDHHPAVYLYTHGEIGSGVDFRARMFGPGLGIMEDPATGSAAAAFASVLMQSEPMSDGEHRFVIEQGIEMGRRSIIILRLSVRHGVLSSVEIGGQAVIVARGELML